MDWNTFETGALAKCEAIEISLNKRIAEFNQVLALGQAVFTENGQNAADLDAISYGETPLHHVQDGFGKAELKLVLLGHDIEIAVAQHFVDQLIDLDSVVPPIDVKLDPNNTAQVHQYARAQLVNTSNPPCKVLATTHLAIDTPIEVAILGQSAKADLFIPLQVTRAPQQPTWERKFVFRSARGPTLCPPDKVRQLISGRVIDGHVRTEVLNETQKIPPADIEAQFIDEIFGPSFLYAALATDNLAFFGIAGHRPRHVLPPLGPLPAWSSAGLKFHQSLLQAQVLAKAPAGAFLPYFTADIGAQVFRFAIAIEMEGSKGGDLFRVTVRVRVTGNFLLAIKSSNPNWLRMDSIQQGNLQIDRVNVEIKVFNSKIHVPGLDHVVDVLATELANRLIGDLGNYSTSIDELVPNCRQIDTQVLPEALAIFVSYT
jgi:hypothetical protein